MSNQDITTRAAKAIYEGRNGHGCKPWAHLTKEHQKPYLADAKEALAVMGEAPSQTELDSQPRYTTKRLRDEVAKAKNYARIEALEDAARQAENVPCEPWKSIAAAIRRLKAPSQTDRAEGGE